MVLSIPEYDDEGNEIFVTQAPAAAASSNVRSEPASGFADLGRRDSMREDGDGRERRASGMWFFCPSSLIAWLCLCLFSHLKSEQMSEYID